MVKFMSYSTFIEMIRNFGHSNGVKKPIIKRKTVDYKSDILDEDIKRLPPNYNFEISKCLYRILNEGHKKVALQFPEGLLMFACILTDILKRHANIEILTLGDVTYGACCVDDFTAFKLGASLLIHYGHSCLVPINVTRIKILYVFVEIGFDTTHLEEVLKNNFLVSTFLILMGTVQFSTSLHVTRQNLLPLFPNILIPQEKPLSAGETLGCTAAKLDINSETSAIIFVADGRFHLEAAMIQNPCIPAFRYDPYSKVMTKESYEHETMKAFRLESIEKAKNCTIFGVILGTLGRQGNPSIFTRLKKKLLASGRKAVQFLMAEIHPQKLALIEGIEAWVQVACPRLSIDWGKEFEKPVLTPYELEVMLDSKNWKEVYPMDYYGQRDNSWSNYNRDK